MTILTDTDFHNTLSCFCNATGNDYSEARKHLDPAYNRMMRFLNDHFPMAPPHSSGIEFTNDGRMFVFAEWTDDQIDTTWSIEFFADGKALMSLYQHDDNLPEGQVRYLLEQPFHPAKAKLIGTMMLPSPSEGMN